jgi:hypothetical protein
MHFHIICWHCFTHLNFFQICHPAPWAANQQSQQ